MQSLLILPREAKTFLHDSALINIIYLSMFFTYGGVSMHAITKMLSHSGLRNSNSEAAQLNRYFHMSFSHNLVFGGCIIFSVALAMLELNHTNPTNIPGMTSLIIRGLLLAFVLLFAMYSYTRSRDQYVGRWSDFKAVFLITWASLVLIYLAIKKSDSSFYQYQLALPLFLALSLIGLLNIFLIVRRIRRHKLYSPYRFISFHRQKRHPTVQKSQNDFKGRFQDKVENEY
jgi:hypothetical protein